MVSRRSMPRFTFRAVRHADGARVDMWLPAYAGVEAAASTARGCMLFLTLALHCIAVL